MNWIKKYDELVSPLETIAKMKHGFGLPFGIWLSEHKPLGEVVGDSLSAFKCRGLINLPYIDTLLTRYQAQHASYYGVMLWVVTMFEQWFALRRTHLSSL